MKTVNEQTTDTEPQLTIEFPNLKRIGLLSAANQGPYQITGFQHAKCEGSIALLPLYRNAEGSHILQRLINDEHTRFGVIFKGEIHTHFPQFRFALARLDNAFVKLFSSYTKMPTSPINTLAFAEQGKCKIAEQVAKFTL